MNRFDRALEAHDLTLRRGASRVLQLNLGKQCNQTCTHCHVGAGPARREAMSEATIDLVLDWLDRVQHRGVELHEADLTGGAPELHPRFRFLVEQLRARGLRVTDRCNLTVLWEPGQEDTAEFLAAHGVTVVASLPCYEPDNVEQQRGNGVFDLSIAALRRLNQLGYGRPGLELHLVYNPNGAFLPPAQADLERDFRARLRADFGIEFNSLFALANMPIARFAASLRRENTFSTYLALLEDAFNPATVDRLMCRDTLNVAWTGELFDCDFNAMLRLPAGGRDRKIWEIEPDQLLDQGIATGAHCFGCTAGAGSSCGGALQA